MNFGFEITKGELSFNNMATLGPGEKMTTLSSSSSSMAKAKTLNTASPLRSSRLLALKRKYGVPDLQLNRIDHFRFTDFDHQRIQRDTVSFGGNGFGVFSRRGEKSFMEDSHRVVPCLVGSSKKGFFGVYDGHGGVEAAEFVAENIHKNVIEMMKDCKEKEEKVEACKAAYLRTDRDFLKEGVESGACCVTVLIQDQEMIISNLGDCRAVLCRGDVAEALTNDHKAGREDERERIESQGGYVDEYRGAWRVSGRLAVSRSIGDADLKKWVIAEPETSVLELKQDMEFLVLASDGLWDVISNQEAIDTVLRVQKMPRETEDEEKLVQGLVNVSPSSKRHCVSMVKSSVGDAKSSSEKEPASPHCEIESPPAKLRKIAPSKRMKMKSESSWAKEACKELANLAVRRGSIDDITVMIIDLNHYKC